MSVRAAGILVVSMLQSLLALEVPLPAAALPVMAVAILCVLVAHLLSALPEVDEPAPVHESTPEHAQAPEISPVLASACECPAYTVSTRGRP